MALDAHLHLRRRKDSVEVITLPDDRLQGYGKRAGALQSKFTPVRYVKTGRKGYIKDDSLETEFVVIGKADPQKRWDLQQTRTIPVHSETAAALEDLREQDIRKVRKQILGQIHVPTLSGKRVLQDTNPSANAIATLDAAIHMILAGT